MPDFIVIDEVNNKVNQSEANVVTHVLASNTAILGAVNNTNTRINNMYNVVNGTKVTTNLSGTKKSVGSSTQLIQSYDEDAKRGLCAKFIAPRTGVYQITGNGYASNTARMYSPTFYVMRERTGVSNNVVLKNDVGNGYNSLAINTCTNSYNNYMSYANCGDTNFSTTSNGASFTANLFFVKDEPVLLGVAGGGRYTTHYAKITNITYYD